MADQAGPDAGPDPVSTGAQRPRAAPPGSVHDVFFKSTFSVAAHAASLARVALPAVLAARLDLEELTPVPGSFSDSALASRHTDLLFTVPVRGEDRYVYLLLEHQSQQHPAMALKVAEYLIRIWDQHLRAHPGDRQLPRVITLVVHHDRDHRRWARPAQLADLLGPGLGPGEQPRLAPLEYLLLDLEAASEDQLRDPRLTPQAQLTLLMLKIAAGDPDVPAGREPWLGPLLRQVRDQPGGTAEVSRILTYISQVSETPPEAMQALAARLGREVEEEFMTTVETIEARGRREGEAIGRREGEVIGRREGEVIGRREALVQVLTARFGTLPDDKSDQVQAGSAGQLGTWLSRAGTARSLDEVFA